VFRGSDEHAISGLAIRAYITAGKLAAIISVAVVRCDTCTALVALINDRRLQLRPACVGRLACISGLEGAGRKRRCNRMRSGYRLDLRLREDYEWQRP
jgi:hypothetical protein